MEMPTLPPSIQIKNEAKKAERIEEPKVIS